MTQVTIVTGGAGTGKTQQLLEGYRAALERSRLEGRPGAALWLTPTRRIQRVVLQQAIAESNSVCFSPHVLTFDRFAEEILKAAGRPASALSSAIKRLLLRRIAADLLREGELRHFQPIVHTTGFLDVVSSFISELKREEVWPEHFVEACKKPKPAFARRDLELGLLYSRYQQHLTEQSWYDNEGRFWLARTALSEGVRGPFNRTRSLFVDGFADFTQTQYEILGLLAGWIDEIVISLPIEHPLDRCDLFSKSQAAVDRIREHLPAQATCRIEPLVARSSQARESPAPRHGWAASIGVIADRLFSNPRFVQASSNTEGLEVIAAKGQLGEWQAVARRIKSMLASGTEIATESSDAIVRPQDIVVGLRSMTKDGPRLRDYLVQAGLPVWCEAESPLISSPIIKAVLSLLQLELDNWPFERLIGVLDSNFFRPDWPELKAGKAARAIAALLRRVGIHAGRELVLHVANRYGADAASDELKPSETLKSLARLASPLLNRLSRSLERLRRPHTLGDWADVLATLANEIGWKFARTESADPLALEESRDLDLFQRIVRTAAETDQKLSKDDQPRPMDLAEFVSELRDLLSHETISAAPEIGGCIRILSVEQIRNLDAPHLFLIGMTESSFPMNRGDDCLFSDAERQEFAAHGVALPHRSGQHADEMLLFYGVVTRARRSLTLSYPAVDSKGQQVFPSPYVTALTRQFVNRDAPKSPEGQLDPVPALDRVLTPSDLRVAAMSEATRGRPGLFRTAFELDSLRPAMRNTLAACDVADYRFHQRGFTQFEGRLESPQNQAWLYKRFGQQHQFSATELESYARCPFQFWLSHVLNVAPLDSPEEGTDPRERGTLLHDVLATLLEGGHMSDLGALPERFVEIVSALLDRRTTDTQLQQALVNLERSILCDWADAFGSQEAGYHVKTSDLVEGVRSLDPEIPFGQLPYAHETAKTAHPAVRFGRDERLVLLRGRIDRVDVGNIQGQPAYIVIDYKTGKRPQTKDADLVSGRSIQLGLYLLAIKRLGLAGREAIPFQMGYWALGDTGFKHAIGRGKFERIPVEKIQWLEAVFDRLLPELADEIRSGRFVVENEDSDCTGRCPYRTVCRVNQIRPLAEQLAKQSPPRLNPADASLLEQPGQDRISGT